MLPVVLAGISHSSRKHVLPHLGPFNNKLAGRSWRQTSQKQYTSAPHLPG